MLLKNVDVLITRDFLKVNAPSIKYIQIIDLAFPVNPEHPSTKITLLDDKLEVNLYKAEVGMWDYIAVMGLNREQIRVRREESLRLYYAREEEKLEAAKQTKLA